MSKFTKEEYRYALQQGLANTRIEGHVPSAEFLSDYERLVRGEIRDADILAASLARAQVIENEAKPL